MKYSNCWFTLLVLLLQIIVSKSSPPNSRNSCKSFKKGRSTRKFVIDTDAGADDAIGMLLAILKAREDPCFEIVAITCVYGNSKLSDVAINVQKTLAVADEEDIPVYLGAKMPLIYKNRFDYFFGKDGFGDFEFPAAMKLGPVEREHAVLALISLAQKYKGELQVIALGPLTNLALAMRMDPNFRENIKQLYVMGGTVEGRGNIGLGKEFNFLADPEANFIVLNSTERPISPIELTPWDTVVLRSNVTMDWRLNVFGKLGTKYTDFINLAEREALSKGTHSVMWLTADPHCVAAALWPELILKSETHYVQAMIQGEGRGTLLVDYYDTYGSYKNVKIIQEFDEEGFKEKLLKYFASA